MSEPNELYYGIYQDYISFQSCPEAEPVTQSGYDRQSGYEGQHGVIFWYAFSLMFFGNVIFMTARYKLTFPLTQRLRRM